MKSDNEEMKKNKWDKNNEDCLKCLSQKDYQKGRIPPCEIYKLCVYTKEYRKYLKSL